MPHVLIEGPCSVRRYWEEFEPEEWRDGPLVVRTISAFMGRDGRSVLVECAVVEGFLRQIFLAHLHQKDEGIMVRVFHTSGPERTEGLRRCLGRIAGKLLAQDASCRWGTDTLGIPPPH